MNKTSLTDIEESIVEAGAEEQRQLLADLPHLLKLSPSDLALLKQAEPAFDFWHNSDDTVYDTL